MGVIEAEDLTKQDDELAKAFFKPNKEINIDDLEVLDSDWSNEVFFVKASNLNGSTDVEIDHGRNRFFTTAAIKFTDTSIGGNLAINSKYQFTRYADIRHAGRLST